MSLKKINSIQFTGKYNNIFVYIFIWNSQIGIIYVIVLLIKNYCCTRLENLFLFFFFFEHIINTLVESREKKNCIMKIVIFLLKINYYLSIELYYMFLFCANIIKMKLYK